MKTLLLIFLAGGVWGADIEFSKCEELPQLKVKKIGCNMYEVLPYQKELSGQDLIAMVAAQSSARIDALEKRVEQIEKESMIRDLEIKDHLVAILKSAAGEKPTINPHPFGTEPENK